MEIPMAALLWKVRVDIRKRCAHLALHRMKRAIISASCMWTSHRSKKAMPRDHRAHLDNKTKHSTFQIQSPGQAGGLYLELRVKNLLRSGTEHAEIKFLAVRAVVRICRSFHHRNQLIACARKAGADRSDRYT